MKLSELHIYNLRKIPSLRLALNPHINIITGLNGSGKTSFLEALYLLSTGCSFRTRESNMLISDGYKELTVYAKTEDGQAISIQKRAQQSTIAKINNNVCSASSELAFFLPSQLIYQDIFDIIEAGPQHRRQILDWGMFHVEQKYFAVWKAYTRTLKQRNALLRKQASLSYLLPWNKLLADLAMQLHNFRSHYYESLEPVFLSVLGYLSNTSCTLAYYKGWDRKKEDKPLEAILNESYERDIQRQFTHYGAHQADLLFESEDNKAKHFLSRGQQKMVLIALKLAQITLLSKDCLVLIDDIGSELDEKHIASLLAYLKKQKQQLFITIQSLDKIKSFISSEQYNCFSMDEILEQ